MNPFLPAIRERVEAGVRRTSDLRLLLSEVEQLEATLDWMVGNCDRVARAGLRAIDDYNELRAAVVALKHEGRHYFIR